MPASPARHRPGRHPDAHARDDRVRARVGHAPHDVARDAHARVGAQTAVDLGAEALAIDGEQPDERLRLVFTCCHPTLNLDAQVALSLRTLCGLSTAEVARVLLLPEATVAKRLTRAKQKIATARIPYRVPSDAELPGRLRGVLATVYLMYTEGYAASSGDAVVRDALVDEALRLAAAGRAAAAEDALRLDPTWMDAFRNPTRTLLDALDVQVLASLLGVSDSWSTAVSILHDRGSETKRCQEGGSQNYHSIHRILLRFMSRISVRWRSRRPKIQTMGGDLGNKSWPIGHPIRLSRLRFLVTSLRGRLTGRLKEPLICTDWHRLVVVTLAICAYLC